VEDHFSTNRSYLNFPFFFFTHTHKFSLLDGSLGAFDAAGDRLVIVGSRILSKSSGFVTNADGVVTSPVLDLVSHADRRAAAFALHTPLWSDVAGRFGAPTDPTSSAAISAAMMAPVGVQLHSDHSPDAHIAVLAHTVLDVPRDNGSVDKIPIAIISDIIRIAGSPAWAMRSPLKTVSGPSSTSSPAGSSSSTASHQTVTRTTSGLLDNVKRKASSRFDFLGGLFSSGGAPQPTAAAAAAAVEPADSRVDANDLVAESDALPFQAKTAPAPATTTSTPLSPSSAATNKPAAHDVELDVVQQAAITSMGTAAFFSRLSRPEAADVLARLRAFVREFAARVQQAGVLPPNKRPAVVRRFVEGMTARVRQHPFWADASEDELSALPDALEKYATTKLYKLIFQPDVAPDKAENVKLADRIKSLGWIEPRHLDVSPELVDEAKLAQAVQQLLKLEDYKPPRDKLICILNCFAADDHQLLTNKGFLSLAEVEAHMAANGGSFGDMLVAGYDVSRQQLVYETPRQLVVNGGATQRLVEFAQRGDGCVSVAVTPDHDMYVTRNGGLSYGKVRASALMGESELAMLACAARGVRDDGKPVSQLRAELERVFGAARSVVVATVAERDELVRAALHAGVTASAHASGAVWRVTLECAASQCRPVLSRASGDTIALVPYSGRTWCFEMPSGFVVARRVSERAVSRPVIHGNCCKVLYTIAESAHRAGADELLPLLIFVVIRANLARLYSHTQYISLYRGAEGLLTEPGYYFTQLMSAIAFLERCDASLLTISPEEFAARMSGQRAAPMSPPPIATPTTTTTTAADLLTLDLPSVLPSGEFEAFGNTAMPVDRFLECDPQSLGIADVAELLQSYRTLVAENAQLREQLRGVAPSDMFDSVVSPMRGTNGALEAKQDTAPSLL
jgi:hypothetical protein